MKGGEVILDYYATDTNFNGDRLAVDLILTAPQVAITDFIADGISTNLALTYSFVCGNAEPVCAVGIYASTNAAIGYVMDVTTDKMKNDILNIIFKE